MTTNTAAKTPAEIELRPDGYERFLRAVDAATKSSPKPKAKDAAKSVEQERQD